MPSEGVIAASGAAAGGSANVAGHYTVATPAAPGAVTLVLVKTTGFDVGEFATIAFSAAGGSTPKAADFSTAGFKAVDQNGAAIAGLEVTRSVSTR